MRRWLCGFVFAVTMAVGCREAITANVPVAARAGDYELTVRRLSEIVAQGRGLALRRDVVERLAALWVDYSLFAQRVLAGDSLLDSATVFTTLWPESRQRIAALFHERLIEAAPPLSVDRVDSIYNEGEYRLIQHVLVRTDPTTPREQRDEKRRRVENMHANLAGGAPWSAANRFNEDTVAKRLGGTVGVIKRGDAGLPAFEDAAFSLGPGELSSIVETQYGYHILARPALGDARQPYTEGLRVRLQQRLDSVYLADLSERRAIEVHPRAPARVRSALADPKRAAKSTKIVGTYDGGKFTVSDFVRWLQLLPPQFQQQADAADDELLQQFLRSLMRNAVMQVEAESAGVSLSALDLDEFRTVLKRELSSLEEAIRVDSVSLADSAANLEERQRLAALRVDQYLAAVVNSRVPLVPIPALLAAKLRDEGEWRIVPAGIARVLERARQLRLAAANTEAAIPGGGQEFPLGTPDTTLQDAIP